MTYILLAKALHKERTVAESAPGFYFDIYPYPYQKEILDKLEAERLVRDHWRNLIVAATGTGKTVVAAFDYKRFRDTNPGKPCSLLFVAHREEILKQSLDCFRMVLKDNNFGELFVGRYEPSGYGPNSLRHLFMSIQTFNSRGFDSLTSPELYDYIVVDEFHHAAARTYQKLLAHYRPKILLGLTATPERMDGKSILEFFDNRIAAEIRLPEAIERKLLCPFQYFGVTDTVDLNSLKWTRGGYDRNELINIYSFSGHVAERRGKMIIESIYKYITDINEVKGLGFCVSREHAKFMAEFFNDYGVPSLYLTSASNDEERSTAKNRLVSGEIRFIFVVDLYNEGVDIPEVDTILFLRPTESLTVFLQQLGRGLRLAENKECLTVLDFIGQANKRYNFQEKFEALLSNTQQSLTRQLKDGFVSLPKGCYIQLEKKAREHILDNIRSAFGQKSGLITKIAAYEEDTGDSVSLAKFLDYYHLDLKTVYKRYSFSRLCVDAGVRDDFNEPEEVTITKAFARVCSIDSRRWISFLLEILPKIDTLNKTKLTASQNRMLLMFHYTVWQKSLPDCGFKNLVDSFARLKQNPVMFGELLELLRYCYDKIDFVDEYVDLGYDSSLDLYCRYSRDQILAAVDYFTEKRKPSMREGVKYIPEKEMDIFLITLNKAEKDYSPSTMYEDYSINEYLFHWQSQSTTSDTSPTGQRYIKHREMGSKILLFVREFKDDVLGASPYTFLGLADYVSHEGSRPMNIIWQLQKPIPPKYLKKTNKLVVG